MSSKPFPDTKPKPWDALVVAIVVLLAAGIAFFFYSGKNCTADLTVVVSVGGETVERVRLKKLPDEPAVYTHNGYTLTVQHVDNGIAVTESDCPTQDCVHTGIITRAGQSIVCLPAQIVIHLESTDTAVPDVIVG